MSLRASNPFRRPTHARLVPALLVLLAAPGCTSGPESAARPSTARKRVVVAVPVGPQHLDPEAGMDEFTASLLGNVYEWLTAADSNLRPSPGLAERWSTLDERTWVFELRRGVRFHDGRTLDARVAAEAFRRAASRSGQAKRAIESVEARGDFELVVKTREPQVAVLEVAAPPIALEPMSGSGPLVGTGAYRIVSGGPQGSVQLEAFADHWAGAPAIERLEFRVMPREVDRIAALAAGEVDLVVNLSGDGARAVAGLARARLVRQGGLRVVFLGLVVREGGEVEATPFGDVRVRRAVAYALDRPGIVERALGGYGEVVQQVVTPELFGHAPSLEPIPFDPGRSRALIAEAGWPQGFAIELAFPQARYQAIEAVAEAVAADLARVGVSVTPKPERPDTIARTEPSAPAFLMGWITSHSGAATYDQLFHTRVGPWGAHNLTRFSDAQVDAALAAAIAAPVDEQRGLLIEVAHRVRVTLPVVPLYRQLDLYGVSEGLVFDPRPQRHIVGREFSWSASEAKSGG